MEATQFTYFQQLGGVDCDPVTVELTYGLERLAMYLQGVENVFDLVLVAVGRGWRSAHDHYGDVYQENEREFSRYNFEVPIPTCCTATSRVRDRSRALP